MFGWGRNKANELLQRQGTESTVGVDLKTYMTKVSIRGAQALKPGFPTPVQLPLSSIGTLRWIGGGADGAQSGLAINSTLKSNLRLKLSVT